MFQEVILVGVVKKDAELRYTPNSTAVCDFIIVVTERWEDRGTGSLQERVNQFRVTAWGGLAEDSAQYLVEGQALMVLGRVDDAFAWMDENGEPHARLDMTARRIVPVLPEAAETKMFQQIVLAGNLGRDPELRYTSDGTAVTDFSIAVNEYRYNSETQQSEELTTWFRVTVWRRQAETASQYLAKGRRVMVIGRLEPASAWIGQGGEARGSLEVTALRFRFMDSRRDDGGTSSPTVYSGGPPAIDEDEIPF